MPYLAFNNKAISLEYHYDSADVYLTDRKFDSSSEAVKFLFSVYHKVPKYFQKRIDQYLQQLDNNDFVDCLKDG